MCAKKEKELNSIEHSLKQKDMELRLRLENLDTEIRNAILEVKDTYEAKLMDEVNKCKTLENERKVLEDKLASSRSRMSTMSSTAKTETNGLGRTNSVPSSVRTLSKRTASVSAPLHRRTESVCRNQPRDPPIPESKVKLDQAKPLIQSRRTNGKPNATTNPATPKELLMKLKKEKDELLKKKLVPPTDAMIKTIDAQLKKFGVYNK